MIAEGQNTKVLHEFFLIKINIVSVKIAMLSRYCDWSYFCYGNPYKVLWFVTLADVIFFAHIIIDLLIIKKAMGIFIEPREVGRL